MARYIDADALMEKCFTRLKDGEVLYRISPQEIDEAPTADVAPKSEVAREIFEKIEYLIWQNDTHPASELTEALATLKKKYTEGGT